MQRRMLAGSTLALLFLSFLTFSTFLTATVARAAFLDSGQVNPQVLRTNGQISAWADAVVEFQRGPLDYADPGLGLASFGSPTDVLGPSGTPCSLGDGGSITLGFPLSIENGPGVDLVVFENSFVFGGEVFAELAFVEVSTNGVDFARLPAICRIERDLGAYDGIRSDEVYNLAGNYAGGTAFDLEDLRSASEPLVAAGVLDLDDVRYVRVVDVIGDRAHASTVDYFGQAVSDPYPTAFASGGFDLTGIAVMNPAGAVSTEPTSWGRVKSLY